MTLQRFALNPDSVDSGDALTLNSDGDWVMYTDAQAAIDAAVLDRTNAEGSLSEAQEQVLQLQAQIASLQAQIKTVQDERNELIENNSVLTQRLNSLTETSAETAQQLLAAFNTQAKLRQAAQSAVANLNNVLASN